MNENEPQFTNVNSYNMPQKKPKQLTFALLSFVFSLLPPLISFLVCCCCCCTVPVMRVLLTIIPLVVSIITLVLGIISLARHEDGKGFAIAGIIISVLTIIPLLFSLIFLRGVTEDMIAFSQDPQKYIDDYKETGEIPEEFSEYEDPKYDWFWRMTGSGSFSEFYGSFLEQYEQQNSWMLAPSSGSSSSENESSNDSSEDSTESSTLPANYGEDPITI